MPARTSGQIHKATRFHQSNVAALEAGGGVIRSVGKVKKKGRRGGAGGQSERAKKARELNDQLKNL